MPDRAFGEQDNTPIAGIACSSTIDAVFVSYGRRVHIFRSDGTVVRQFEVQSSCSDTGADTDSGSASDRVTYRMPSPMSTTLLPGCLAVDDSTGELYVANKVFNWQGVVM